MRNPVVVVAVIVIALFAGTGAGAANLPGSSFFRLSRVHVQPQRGALLFSVAVTHVRAHDNPDLEWSLAPVGGPACENRGYANGLQSKNGLVVWDQRGPTFRWQFKTGTCTGTVSVIAENSYEHCTSRVVVTSNDLTSGAPACALGGYAVGFSTLPVPAGVFDAYRTVVASLNGAPKSPAVVAKTIRAVLGAQSRAFALFPPLWACDFSRVLAGLVALRVDMLRGRRVAADVQAAKASLANCAPPAVSAALARAATSTSTTTLDAVFAHAPPVFGFHLTNLVDSVAAETLALDRAEHAAKTGDLTLASQQLEAAANTASSLSRGVNRYQHHVIQVENANG
jgi:hypothetical protein